jgi:signal transduction histidine kinase
MFSRAETKARFEALREKTFEEMAKSGKRWRIGVMVPMQGVLLSTLVVGGAAKHHVVAQAVLIALMVVLHLMEERFPERKGRFVLGALVCQAAIWNTGGLSSPLLPSALPFLMVASIVPRIQKERFQVFMVFLVGLGLCAAVGRTPYLPVPAPFIFEDGMPTRSYLLVASVSVLSTVFGLYVMGRELAKTYEKIAIELAARRDELVEDNDERARSLEGITLRLAHEVKNPLSAIKGLSTHIARSTQDAKVAERLNVVAAEADRIQTIVDGFVSFSRGMEELSVSSVKPIEVAQAIRTLMELRAEEAGVEIAVSGNGDLTIEADGRKLRQAMLNLVINALQASPRGSRIDIEVARAVCGVTAIRIIDHGEGMSQEVLDRIKRPYFTTRQGGSGLGLAVARSIIEQHGGRLAVESAPGKGTTVTIEFEVKCMFAGLPKMPKLMPAPTPQTE